MCDLKVYGNFFTNGKKKGNAILVGLDRPWGYRRLRPQDLKTVGKKGDKVVSPTHRPPLLPQEIFPILISVRGCVDPRAVLRPEGCQRKIPMAPSGIELFTGSGSDNRGSDDWRSCNWRPHCISCRCRESNYGSASAQTIALTLYRLQNGGS